MKSKRSESEPRQLLDATNHTDKVSHIQPRFYSRNMHLEVPLIHPTPFSCLGASNQVTEIEDKDGVDKFVYRSMRRIHHIDPKRDKSTEFKVESALYKHSDKFVAPPRLMITKSGMVEDGRKPWNRNVCSRLYDPRSDAAADSWDLYRPAHRFTNVQMGLYYMNRI